MAHITATKSGVQAEALQHTLKSQDVCCEGKKSKSLHFSEAALLYTPS